MPKRYQLPILWTVRCDPISIIEMLNDERITALIASDHFICRIGSLVNKYARGSSVVAISPTEPHGKISDIYKEDDIGWYGDVYVSEKWTDLIDSMEDPILHPLIIGNTSSKEFRLVHFAIMNRTDVSSDRIYDGVHWKENSITLVEGESTGEPHEVPDEILKFKGKTVDPFKVPDPTAHDVALAVKGAMSKWDKLFRDEVKSRNQPEQIKKLILDLTSEYVKGMTEMVDKAVAELGVTDNNECS